MTPRRILNFIAVLVFGIIAVGCDSLSYTQYVVANISPADRIVVKQIVKGAASDVGLTDQTSTSTVPGSLAFYLQQAPHFPVSLGLREVDGAAIIDLGCSHPGIKKPPVFTTAESRLTSTLSNEFGHRLTMPDDAYRVPLLK